jgi:hypothetical protein
MRRRRIVDSNDDVKEGEFVVKKVTRMAIRSNNSAVAAAAAAAKSE